MCKRRDTENNHSSHPIVHALTLLKQTDDQTAVDKGFDMLLKMTDAGDMTACAYVGYASQFQHIGHYDLERCREYLERSALEGDSMGMYFLGQMLTKGELPFEQDKVRGRWLLKNAGCPEAERFLENWYREEMTPAQARRMLVRSWLRLGWERVKGWF